MQIRMDNAEGLTEHQIQEHLGLLKALPIRVETQSLSDTVDLQSLARRWNLTAYDVAYLDLALRLGAPFATCDQFLRDAATVEGITVIV